MVDRAIRSLGLPVAAPLLLVGLALFFGGGPSDGSIFWLGGGALAAMLVLLGTSGVPGGWTVVVPLAGLAVWCAASIAWSGLPDRSWDYANRACLYALFAALGLWAAGRTRALAQGLAVVLGAVIVWSLLGKVFPVVYDYGGPDVTRLRGPIGLWNQLALATDFALALSLALRRRAGTLLGYVAIVALVLTYSRGGVLTALLICAAWFALGDGRADAAITLVASALPAVVVGGIAFALPGVTSDAQSLHVRWRDGLVFGALLLAGAGAAVALERLPRPRDTFALRLGVAVVAMVAVVAGIVFVVVHGVGTGAVTNSGGGHFSSTSSNFRFTWWHQAWRGFLDHPLVGYGAGSFTLLNRLYRSTFLDFTIEPHDLPVQMLAEVGAVGFAVFVVACAALVRASFRRSGHELALALFLPAFLVHALIDVDWDFVAVAAPAFLAAGALVGRPASRRVGGFGLMPAAGVALALFGAFLSPWLARRWVNDAYGAAPARAVALANRAHSVDPLLVDPYWAKALALTNPHAAWAQYLAAVRRQPKNPQTWLLAGEFAKSQNCPLLEYQYLEKFTELDPQNRPDVGGDDYRDARAKVNRHAYTC